jgi:hypothetical protein
MDWTNLTIDPVVHSLPGWAHLVLVVDRTEDIATFYANGEALDSRPPPGASLSPTLGTQATISHPIHWFAGALDEVRVSPVPLSAAWVRAEYENLRPGSTFVRVGALETAPDGG